VFANQSRCGGGGDGGIGFHCTLSSLSIYVLLRDARPKYKGKGIPVTWFAGSRCGWVTNAMRRPFYPQSKRPCTHCAQSVSRWVVQTNGQEVCGEDVLTSPGCEPRSIQSIA